MGLSIVDGKNCTVYELHGSPAKREENVTRAVSSGQMASLEKELERTGVKMEAVKDRYRIGNPEEMSEETYRKVMSALAKTKSRAA